MNTMQNSTQKSDIVQFTTFLLRDELFGVDALQVQEILPYQEITSVPLAPEYVKGLINLRGQIVTVLDLRDVVWGLPLWTMKQRVRTWL